MSALHVTVTNSGRLEFKFYSDIIDREPVSIGYAQIDDSGSRLYLNHIGIANSDIVSCLAMSRIVHHIAKTIAHYEAMGLYNIKLSCAGRLIFEEYVIDMSPQRHF